MDQEQRKQLGDKIREARKARGWSQARLAAEAGVSENTILSLEHNRRENPQDGKLRPVLDALGMATPADGSLDLDGVPDDVRVFLTVAAQRLKVLGEGDRARILAAAYPLLLG